MSDSGGTRRRFLRAAGSFGAMAGLGAPLGAAAQGERPFAGQSITHWSFLSPEGRSLREIALKEIEAHFTERTGIGVAFQTFPWHELKTKLIAAVQAGNPPDNARVDAIALRMVVKANALTNLDPYVARTFTDAEKADFLVDFAPPALVDGHKWGMLLETAARALFVRKDMLAKAGLKAPRTWSEFVEAGRAMTGGGRWGYMYGGSKTQLGQTDFVFQSHIHGRGGRILLPGDKGGFNDEAAVRAYQFLSDCVHKHRITPSQVINMTHDNVSDAFKAGRVGMYVEVSPRYRDIEKAVGADNLEVVEIPSDEPGLPSPTVVTGWSLGIPRGARNPDASWEYVKEYVGPRAQEINARVAGSLPSRKSVFDLPFFKTPEAAHMRWWMSYIEKRGEPPILTATFSELNEIMVDALHRVLLDPGADVKQVLDESVRRYDQIA